MTTKLEKQLALHSRVVGSTPVEDIPKLTDKELLKLSRDYHVLLKGNKFAPARGLAIINELTKRLKARVSKDT